MPYTAVKIIGWMIAAFVLGLLLGWFLWRWARFRVTEEQWADAKGERETQRLRIADLEEQYETVRNARARDLESTTKLRTQLADAHLAAATAGTPAPAVAVEPAVEPAEVEAKAAAPGVVAEATEPATDRLVAGREPD